MTQPTSQAVADALAAAGVRYVFGHPGGEIVDLLHAFEKTGIRFVLMGHECAAAFAAGTLGRATGIPGVCVATLGPGACNLVLGVGDAFLDRHPMVALSARTAASIADGYSHQNLDLNAMFAPITKASIELDGVDTEATVRRSAELATTPPLGPVYLSLPGDVAGQPDKADKADKADKTGDGKDGGAPKGIRAAADVEALATIQEALNKAERPVAVVGLALDQDKDGPAVREFLATTGIPYVDTPKTKGLVDPTSDAFLGTCVSASGDPLIAETLAKSDCLIGIGFDPVETTYDWHRSHAYYGITNAPTDYGTYHPHVEIVGDVSALVAKLGNDYTGQPTWRSSEWKALRKRIEAEITPEVASSDVGLAPLHVLRTMRAVLPDETRLSVDTGSHKVLFAQAWHTRQPLSYFGSNGLSSMGPSVPGAIALALHDPNRPVVGVSGDGGFAMMVQELETVKRLGIAPLFVVVCDQALSLIRIPYRVRGYEPIGIDLERVDWAKVAEGFGIQGLWARSLDEVRTSLLDWRDNPTATVLAVQIDDALYRGNSY